MKISSSNHPKLDNSDSSESSSSEPQSAFSVFNGEDWMIGCKQLRPVLERHPGFSSLEVILDGNINENGLAPDPICA